ncbi:MAG: FtsX-like permease family protein [Nitrosomonas sp.]|uniref:ABC transporter permease n=1 Tax=Nitrosomonas sp. TaxID=42353 RepID=UPI0027352AF1|nr:ABC transporter permease [Nitrosomonas sp.]MDP3662861.1 ABC transporter permease [Nitrosomonas sp.]MDZ4104606.1 FtsX-like permease family protein [Nitrosomonas sp.]
MFAKVAWHSLQNRRYTAILTIISVAISTFVLLGVEHIRHEAKESFSKTVSGVDLIVGARTSQLNLLLYSVFHIGNPTNNISWQSYRELADDPKVAWTIPISLGDSHQGYRVMGTTDDFFMRFRFGKNTALSFSEGEAFSQLFDVVLGAEVAKKLNYRVGDPILLAHGLGRISFSMHDDKPFSVKGILRPTGTPADQTLYISLQGMEAIHLDWRDGVKIPGKKVSDSDIEALDLTPKSITAFMIGLQSKMAIFSVQRHINQYPKEPLLAILPGITLTKLWQMMNSMENTLRLISILVLFSSLLGLSTMLLSSIRERQREIAVMRAIGASPLFVFLIIQIEALMITLVGIIVAIVVLAIGILLIQSTLAENYGIFINHFSINNQTLGIVGIIILSTFILGLIPSLSAYRMSLHYGLVERS